MSPVTEGEIDQFIEGIGPDSGGVEKFLHVMVHRQTRGKLKRSAAEVVAEAATALGDAAERALVGGDAPGREVPPAERE